MRQYNSIKSKHPDALLLFRVGDFYETFGEDAKKAAAILDIVLTQRNNGGDKTALAGFPHHALNTYLPKLVKAGLRVAICDQLEDPKQTKTIVKRGVTELVTPGVALSDDLLHTKENNFLAAVHQGRTTLGISFLDISTGEFLTGEGTEEVIAQMIEHLRPKEILVAKNHGTTLTELLGPKWHQFKLDDWIFQEDYTNEVLNKHFGTLSLRGFGVDDLAQGIIAAGAILHYLSETQHRQLKHITRIRRLADDNHVWMDRFTIRNLELFHSNHPQGVPLLQVIDRTLTPMGGRLLRRWLALPIKDLDAIQRRHQVVQYFHKDEEARIGLQAELKQLGDLERVLAKIATGKIHPKEAYQFGRALEHLVPIKTCCENSSVPAVADLGQAIDPCDTLLERIQNVLQKVLKKG